MKKTSIYLDLDVDRALTRIAERDGVTKAEVIRRSLARTAAESPRPRLSVGVSEAPGDLAENVDRYLTETGFGED